MGGLYKISLFICKVICYLSQGIRMCRGAYIILGENKMIRVSKMTDYSVVILSCFVASMPGTLLNASELSERTHLPLPTVSKILKILAKADILYSRRGVQGGYVLDRYADDISVAEIVTAIDGPIALTACVDTGDEVDCNVEPLCPMSGGWDKLNAAVKASFEKVSLREISSPVKFVGD